MAAASEDINYVDVEEDVLFYYESIQTLLQGIFIGDVCEDVIRMIVNMIHFTCHSSEDWLLYASAILSDEHISPKDVNIKLAEIKADADGLKIIPLLFALRSPLKWEKTMADLVRVMVVQNRIDILRELKPFMQDHIKHKRSSLLQECDREDDNSTCGSSMTEKSRIVQVESFQNQRLPSVNISQAAKQSSDVKESLTIFIPHTDADLNAVKRLKHILRKYDLSVKLLSDIEHHIASGDCEVLHAILKHVDYIIPVISYHYLNCIKPSYGREDPSREGDHNRFIYKWMLSEYMKNSSHNFRVRPVLLPDVSVNDIRSLRNPIFAYPFRLFDEVPKLVDMLIKAKKSDGPRLLRRNEQIINGDGIKS